MLSSIPGELLKAIRATLVIALVTGSAAMLATLAAASREEPGSSAHGADS